MTMLIKISDPFNDEDLSQVPVITSGMYHRCVTQESGVHGRWWAKIDVMVV
jgi:hypothetical protein